MKDFKAVLIFIIVAFVIPPIVISSGGLISQLVGLGIIATALYYVHALDAQARLLRS